MAKEHLHPTMKNSSCFKKENAIMTVGEEQIACSSGDFISIPANTPAFFKSNYGH